MSILVIGGLYTDFIFDVPRMPLVNDVVNSTAFKIAPGGKALNIATTVRLLQTREVTVLGAIGDDVLSDALVSHMQRLKINTEYVKRVEKASCSVVALFNTDRNTTSSVPYDVTGRCIGLDDLGRIRFTELDAVISTAEVDFEIVEACFERAKTQNPKCQTFFNVAPIEPFLDSSFDWRFTDHLVQNEREARLLLKAEGDELLVLLYEMTGVPSICVTRGQYGGHLLRHGTGVVDYQAHPVEPVNTIGAGDAFLAGYTVGILNGAGLDEALRIAAVTGALTCEVETATNPGLNMARVRDAIDSRTG